MSGWWSGWRSRRHKRAVQEGESVCPTRAYVLAVHVTHCHNMSEWQRAVRQGPLPNCSVTSASAFSQLSLPIRQTEMRVVQLLSPLVFVLLHPLTMPVLTFCMGLNPIPVSLKCFQCGCRAKALVSVLDIWCYTIYVVTGTLAPPSGCAERLNTAWCICYEDRIPIHWVERRKALQNSKMISQLFTSSFHACLPPP